MLARQMQQTAAAIPQAVAAQAVKAISACDKRAKKFLAIFGLVVASGVAAFSACG